MPGVGTTHHVEVAGQYLLLRQGSYRKRAAPLFGARFTTGDPDYNNLTFWQHWVQSCWIGGMGADTWVDDSMYAQGVGVDSSTHEVLVLARDLGRPGTGNWNLGGPGTTGGAAVYPMLREFCVFNDQLYCLEKGATGAATKIYKRTGTGDGTWTNIPKGGGFTDPIRGICSFSGKLWLGDAGGNITYMTTADAYGSKAKPSGRTEVPYCMKVYKGKMYVPFGRYIWRMKNDETWDGNTVFFDAAGIDRVNAMELHQGMLYIGSNNGHILRTDGNVTLDLWSWDGGVVIDSMRSYDGKLFVATSEVSLDGTATEGVLYQFTGSAVTELKRWGKSGVHCPIGKMRVSRRHLFYGAGGLLGIGGGIGVGVYDAVEDAHVVWAANRDDVSWPAGTNGVNHIVDDVIQFGDWLYVANRSFGIFRTKTQFRDVSQQLATYDTTASGATTASLNGGWIESSDFDAGTPGLSKLWGSISLHVDLPNAACSVTVDYSLDGGLTWTTVGVATKTGAATRYRNVWHLENVQGTRIKYRMSLRTTNTLYTPQVRSITVSYLPRPEPNWQWDLTAVVSERQQLLDNTEVDVNVNTVVNALEAAYLAGGLVHFTDVDGTAWAAAGHPGVLITDFSSDPRFIGPSSDGPIEREIRMTLVGATQTYP